MTESISVAPASPRRGATAASWPSRSRFGWRAAVLPPWPSARTRRRLSRGDASGRAFRRPFSTLRIIRWGLSSARPWAHVLSRLSISHGSEGLHGSSINGRNPPTFELCADSASSAGIIRRNSARQVTRWTATLVVAILVHRRRNEMATSDESLPQPARSGRLVRDADEAFTRSRSRFRTPRCAPCLHG